MYTTTTYNLRRGVPYVIGTLHNNLQMNSDRLLQHVNFAVIRHRGLSLQNNNTPLHNHNQRYTCVRLPNTKVNVTTTRLIHFSSSTPNESTTLYNHF